MSRAPAERWRIGVLATRVGVSETLLRAWEMRYGLLSPTRTASGYRLYGPEDERRARAMAEARSRGVSAAQAAAEILAVDRSGTTPTPPAHQHDADAPGHPDATSEDVRRTRQELTAAMVAYDVASMHATLDRLLRTVTVETAIRDVLLPFMAEVGDGWAEGVFDVADEHFASDLVRARLASLAVGATRSGPLALLACPPDEAHDIALKAFEVVLHRAGWRTRFLGPHTPVGSLKAAADVIAPDLVVLAGASPAVFELPAGDQQVLREVAGSHRLALAGAGADAARAADWGAVLLLGDPVAAARQVATDLTHRPDPPA